jgi:hypothetical protein
MSKKGEKLPLLYKIKHPLKIQRAEKQIEKNKTITNFFVFFQKKEKKKTNHL